MGDTIGSAVRHKGAPPTTLVLACYEQVDAEHLTYCYGKDEWLTADTGDSETGGAPDGIDPANWPHDDSSLAYIRTNCTSKCIDWHAEQSGESYICDPNSWVIKSLKEALATDLEDPSALNCWVDSRKRSRSLATTNVIEANSPSLWPSDSSVITLACSNYQTCAALFDEDIMGHLALDGMATPGDNEAEADHLVTSSGMSSSRLTLGIANVDLPSEDSNWVGGRAEYTALDCGQSTCPFYLGNLHVMNTSDAWILYSEADQASVSVTNIHIQLRRPTLGVWRPSTGEIYFDHQALGLTVDYDLTIDGEPVPAATTHAANRAGLFGILHGNNGMELYNVSMHEGDLTASATLHFDSVDGSPPVASFMLPPTVVLDPHAPGLLVSSISEHSTDPDGDPDWKLWLIDSQQVGPGYVIPAGLHTIRLEVRDSRFAFDAQEQLLLITHAEQGS